MSDGRHFTDYKTATRRNEYIKYINGIVRDDDYRAFLQYNATQIANNEWDYNQSVMGCWQNGCVHVYPTRILPQDMNKEIAAFDSLFDPSKPKVNTSCPVYADYRMTENHAHDESHFAQPAHHTHASNQPKLTARNWQHIQPENRRFMHKPPTPM